MCIKLKINDFEYEVTDLEKELTSKVLSFLDNGIPVKSIKVNEEQLLNFFIDFDQRPYYTNEYAFRNSKFAEALNDSLYVIQFRFHDLRGDWFRKRFQQLQKGLSLIKDALED